MEQGWWLAHDEPEEDYKVWIMKHNDGPCVVYKRRVEGITTDMIEKFNANMVEYSPQMDPNVHITDLEPEGDCRIMHVHYKMPGMSAWFISHRSFYMSYYQGMQKD